MRMIFWLLLNFSAFSFANSNLDSIFSLINKDLSGESVEIDKKKLQRFLNDNERELGPNRLILATYLGELPSFEDIAWAELFEDKLLKAIISSKTWSPKNLSDSLVLNSFIKKNKSLFYQDPEKKIVTEEDFNRLEKIVFSDFLRSSVVSESCYEYASKASPKLVAKGGVQLPSKKYFFINYRDPSNYKRRFERVYFETSSGFKGHEIDEFFESKTDSIRVNVCVPWILHNAFYKFCSKPLCESSGGNFGYASLMRTCKVLEDSVQVSSSSQEFWADGFRIDPLDRVHWHNLKKASTDKTTERNLKILAKRVSKVYWKGKPLELTFSKFFQISTDLNSRVNWNLE